MNTQITNSSTQKNSKPLSLVAGKKFLVVDDCKHIQDFLKAVLEYESAQVKCSSSGEEALELCNESKFDFLIIDLRMPGLSGVDTISKLRSKNINTPAIAFSAEDTNNINQKDKFDFDAFLQKPIDRDTLLKTISNILS